MDSCDAYCFMKKGDIYKLSHWFEGDESDWVVMIAPDTYHDNAFFGDAEYHLIGNLFTDDTHKIIRSITHVSLEELRDAIIEASQEEYWDDSEALKHISLHLDNLGVTIETPEALSA